MTTAIGLHIRSSLLGGLVTSAQLETTLNSNGLYVDGFLSLLGTSSHIKMVLDKSDALNIVLGSAKASELLVNNPTAMDKLSDSELAVSSLMKSSTALTKFVDSQVALSMFHSNPAKLDLINSFINVDGYKLKRFVFTSSGTLTYTDTLLKVSEFGVGDGGSGSTVNSTDQQGFGGGGGEVVCKNKTTSFIPTASAVSITDTNNTTVGTTLFVATKGITGDNSPPTTGTGGGSTTGDNIELYLPDTICLDPTKAIWYLGNWTRKGGDGGTITGLATTASDGSVSSSILGTGGIWVSQTSGGIGATGYGNGGAGGGYWGSSGTYNGASANGYGCGGNSANKGGTGGNGSNGLFSMMAIIQ